MRRAPLLLCVLIVGVLAVPEAALAHGIVGRQDLPIPKWLFGWGAAVVLVASFVGLAVLWQRPQLERPAERRLASVPSFLDPLAGAIGVGLFVVVVYAGFAGSQTTTNNLAPTFVYVLFWVGLVVLALLFGDVFKALNPWRAVGRAVAWVAARVSREGLPDPLPYPARLGHWPAAIGILAFTWVELVYADGDDPSTIAVLALAYAAVQFVGMSLYGVDAWSRRGDAFGVYFGLFAKLSPLRWERGAVFGRLPLSGLTAMTVLPGTIALLAVVIGTTSFDGLAEGPLWSDVAPELTALFTDVGFNQARALELAFTVGLLAMPLLVGGLYMLGIRGMRWAGEKRESGELAARFVHTLVPIGMAYVVAHYFSLLAYQGQATAYLASDPLGDGGDLIGTASATIDYSWVSATGIWYVQFGALVIGHVAGLVLAHDRALILSRDSQTATRSQYWMLAVMVTFTLLGLWLLSASNA